MDTPTATKPALIQTLDDAYQHIAVNAETEHDNKLADGVLNIIPAVTELLAAAAIAVDFLGNWGNPASDNHAHAVVHRLSSALHDVEARP